MISASPADIVVAAVESRPEAIVLSLRVKQLADPMSDPNWASDATYAGLGAPAAKKCDIEVWLPSEGRYRELTSCSNYTDYSARRLVARLGESGAALVHTLNGTACAVGRTLLFLFEHYQDEGGALAVPDVLRPFAGFDRERTTG